MTSRSERLAAARAEFQKRIDAFSQKCLELAVVSKMVNEAMLALQAIEAEPE